MRSENGRSCGACLVIYQDLAEWLLFARILIQSANILAGIDPAKGLAALDRAAPSDLFCG
jgi:hypothetical protein